jgi:hypothetical protein
MGNTKNAPMVKRCSIALSLDMASTKPIVDMTLLSEIKKSEKTPSPNQSNRMAR